MREIIKRFIYNPMFDVMDFHLVVRQFDSKRFKLEFKFTEYEPGKAPVGPVLEYDNNVASTNEIIQAIMDAAWQEGMRPSGFKDVLNETTAIKYHLEDMRKLVFKN